VCCIKIGGFHPLIFLPWAEQILLKTYEDIGSVLWLVKLCANYGDCRPGDIRNFSQIFLVNYFELECGPMPNVMVILPNIGGALCSTLPTAQVPCSNATKIREARAQDLNDAKWILQLAKFRNGARTPKNVYVVYQPRRQPNAIQSLVGFRWATSLQ